MKRNRAQMRDAIRRKMRIEVPFDVGAGAEGAQPDWDPDPTNATLNQLIEEVVDAINAYLDVGAATSPVTKTVQAQTANGPYVETMGLGWSGGVVNDDVLQIKSLWWTGSSGQAKRLTPNELSEVDRSGRGILNEAPGTPDIYWEDGYRLWIQPAPNETGTLTAFLGIGLQNPVSDSDGLFELPNQFQWVVYNAVIELYSAGATQDLESRARLESFSPHVTRGMQAIADWQARKLRNQQPRIIADIGRRLTVRRI